MIDLIVKGALAIGAALLVDAGVKELTGKHVHEHVIDFVKSLWARLTNWAQQYLSTHNNVRKVYVSSISILAEWKKAYNKGENFVKLKIFQLPIESRSAKVISDELVLIDQVQGILQQAKANSVLAMRN